MYVMTGMFANREQGVLLWFNDADAARKAYQTLANAEDELITVSGGDMMQRTGTYAGWPRSVNDHYGNVLWLKEPPAAVLMADHEKQLRAQAECALIGARVQADANDQANADPVLRAAGARARAAQVRQFGGGLPLVNG